MWSPQFACPPCASTLEGEDAAGRLTCKRCGRRYERTGGIWRFLTADRASAADAFARQYRAVREREGYRSKAPEYYRALPIVPDDDPHTGEWQIRRQSFRHLHERVLPRSEGLRVLDLGAGNLWLAHRLASAGCRVVAVDRFDDEDDGLGAWRYYPVKFVAVQADFDTLPFEPSQFDLVIFNASLHYAPDVTTTIASARRMLAPGGSLAVMDSPLFHRARDGRAMVADMLSRFRAYGVADARAIGAGFLTFDVLERSAIAEGLHGSFIASAGPFGWRLRRALGRFRLLRAPARFGLWVAR